MIIGNVFGCSHTFGHGLEDCYDAETGWPALKPSKKAWPSILQELGLYDVCYNFSKVGASSDEVLKQILALDRFELKRCDYFIVLWPSFTRRSVYNKNKKLETYRIQDDNPKATDFYKITDQYELKYNYYKNILIANLYLKDFKFYNFFTDLSDMDEHFEFCPNLTEFQHKFSRIDFQYILKKHNKALDNVHLGADGHAELAKLINTFINS
tara:strand:- start:1198 stop:1830 length:633 start_codon:yes stop_codon:yes gene_type:complete